MIITLRAPRPDYRELLLMTHRLPRVAPCCCLLFTYLCSSSGMDLCWVSSIWEPVQEKVDEEALEAAIGRKQPSALVSHWWGGRENDIFYCN